MYRYLVARCSAASSDSVDDGYQVVGASVTDWQDSPIRFVATLTEGQEFVIPVSGKMGERDEAVEVSRTDGKLLVTSVEPETACPAH